MSSLQMLKGSLWDFPPFLIFGLFCKRELSPVQEHVYPLTVVYLASQYREDSN